MKKRLTLFIAFSLLFAQSKSQIAFVKNLNSSYGCIGALALRQTTDGGYIIVGGCNSTRMVKTNAWGDSLWSYQTDTFNIQQLGFSIAQTTNGGYAASGYINYVGAAACRDFILRVSPFGNLQGHTTFGASVSGCSWGQSVIQTDDGGFLSAGSSLFKTDSVGNLSWTKPCAGDQTMYITKTFDNKYVQSGFINNYIVLNKVYITGNTVWTKNYFGTTYNNCDNNFAQTADSGFIITGASVLPYYHSLLIKTNSSGDTLWTKSFAPALVESYGMGVIQTTDGGYLITGFISDSTDYNTPYLYKTNLSGDSVWFHTFPFNFRPHSVLQTTDGGFAFAGENYFIKTDGNGITGISEPSLHETIKISPVPTAGIVHISSSSVINPHTLVSISDVTGKVLTRMHFKEDIDLSSFKNGMYFITIKELNYTAKVILQK